MLDQKYDGGLGSSVQRRLPNRRRQALQVLRASPHPMSITAIADQLDLHPNTVRYHLDSLVGDSVVERVQRRSHNVTGRPPLLFRAVRQMNRGGTRHYRFLAEILIKALAADQHPRDKALAAGRECGNSLAATPESELESPPDLSSQDEAIDRLVDVLDELGFAPERMEIDGKPDGESQIYHRHCPFLELAENHTNLICQLHLGLVQGALEAWRAPISAERLDAFVAPDLCLLHLKRTSSNE